MKYNLIFIVCFILTIRVHATETNNLILYLNSGISLSFPVAEKPQITFEGNVLCINTERFQITDVKKYTFSKNEAVGIETVEAGKDGVAMTRLDGEKIALRAKDASAVVHIYSSKGVEQNVHRTIGTDGQVILDLTGLMPDVYVIAVGDETHKIRKK